MSRILSLILTAVLVAPIVSAAPSRFYPIKRQTVLLEDVTDISGDNTYEDCIGITSGLSFDVLAGVRYVFNARVRFTAAGTTTGSAWSVNGPADPTELTYSARWSNAVGARDVTTYAAYDLPATSAASSAADGNIALIDGVIVPSVDGTVVIRFMTETDTAAVVCQAGSTLEWWETLPTHP